MQFIIFCEGDRQNGKGKAVRQIHEPANKGFVFSKTGTAPGVCRENDWIQARTFATSLQGHRRPDEGCRGRMIFNFCR